MEHATERRPRFGSTLRRFRLEAGKSGVELAEHLGISPAYLHDIERDRRVPLNIERIVRAAELFGDTESTTAAEKMKKLLEAAAIDQAIPFTLPTPTGGERSLTFGVALLLAWSSLTPAHFERLGSALEEICPTTAGGRSTV